MKISIIGSCQTRDILNSKFIPTWKEHFTLGSYFTMTSMLSVMGDKAVSYNFQKLIESKMKKTSMEHWYYELEKPVLTTLENNPPDYLLMDFYADARHGAIMYQGEYLVNRLYNLKGKDIIKWDEISAELSYKKNTKDFLRLWQSSVDRFMDFKRKKLPNTTIIINTVKGTNLVRDKQTGLESVPQKLQNLDIEKINTVWSLMDSYLIDKYGAEAITYEKTYTLDPEYLYGGLGGELVHFSKEYYEDYFKKLVLLTSKDTRKENPVASCPHPNLFLKSSFDYGTEKCIQQVGKFQIVTHDSYESISPVDCSQELGEYRPQMWSKPLEVDGDGQMKYRLSFSFKTSEPEKITDGMMVYAIRVFNDVKSCKMSDALQKFGVRLSGHKIEKDKLYVCIYDFRPEGKYVKAGPFLFQYIPGIEYGHMKLERID